MNISSEQIFSLIPDPGKIITDSRQAGPGSVFLALKGENFDGNMFAVQALEKGARLAIVSDPEIAEIDHRMIRVADTLLTLQELAAIHRRQLKTKIIGITGSNGKTTTKELIGRVLSTSFSTSVTKGNLNNHIGVPLTILSLKQEDFAVIEMGANHQGEIAYLCQIARPAYGIITNIGKAHLEGFGSLEGVARAKSELYRFIMDNNGLLFVNTNHPRLVELAQGARMITYGNGPENDCTGKILERYPTLSVSWSYHSQSATVTSSLYGEYNFENILAAITVGACFGVSPGNINRAISGYVPGNNRSQWLATDRNRLLLDAYNANPSSMKAAILEFGKLEAPHKVIILGDMLELGEDSRKEHAEMLDIIKSLNFDCVILVGEQFCQAAGKGEALCFSETLQAMEWLKKNPVRNSTIMLKGSRLMKLESLIHVL